MTLAQMAGIQTPLPVERAREIASRAERVLSRARGTRLFDWYTLCMSKRFERVRASSAFRTHPHAGILLEDVEPPVFLQPAYSTISCQTETEETMAPPQTNQVDVLHVMHIIALACDKMIPLDFGWNMWYPPVPPSFSIPQITTQILSKESLPIFQGGVLLPTATLNVTYLVLGNLPLRNSSGWEAICLPPMNQQLHSLCAASFWPLGTLDKLTIFVILDSALSAPFSPEMFSITIPPFGGMVNSDIFCLEIAPDLAKSSHLIWGHERRVKDHLLINRSPLRIPAESANHKVRLFYEGLDSSPRAWIFAFRGPNRSKLTICDDVCDVSAPSPLPLLSLSRASALQGRFFGRINPGPDRRGRSNVERTYLF